MFKVTFNLSKSTHPNYEKYAHLLEEGWLFGRKVDNSDAQYAQFRDHIPKLVPLVIAYLIASHFKRGNNNKRSQKYSLALSLATIVLLHGTNVLKMLVITGTSFLIGRTLGGSRLNPIFTWIFNLAILFSNEYYDGYRYASLFGPSLEWMDHYPGVISRWHILFNFTMLRLISFNVDYYWACNEKIKEDQHNVPVSDRERIQFSCPLQDYNYENFLTYVLYTPLLLCGPIITFNDFISQFHWPSPNITKRYVIHYALRLVVVILIMEMTLHYLYVVSISKAKAWEGDSPLEISMVGYFNLVIIWMKLLIPWRFFRLWSLADGIWVEENMVRCMSNNFSAQRFWKSWHRSFNRWMIRYIYVPLGGTKYMGYNVWLVFTFVALWHDIELKLLAWGWLICLFLLPELIATRLFSEAKTCLFFFFFLQQIFIGDKPYYRIVCGLGAVANILMMMIANLVGFAVGLDGVKEMLIKIFATTHGLSFLLSVTICLFIAVQIMFEIRETEKRRGDPKWKM
ncbi:MBOAT-domain-containing protein [Backusella circina FSU 941]|nr:MBOAT-domain-containing protein [Backusella circina FSU 941]